MDDEEQGGACLFVYTERRRVRVPLHDSFYAEAYSRDDVTQKEGSLFNTE